MKIKEFSQKYSVFWFWAAIFLLLVSIALGVCLFKGNMPRGMKGDFGNMGDGQGMMQQRDSGRAMNNTNSKNDKNFPSNSSQKSFNGQGLPQEAGQGQNSASSEITIPVENQ